MEERRVNVVLTKLAVGYRNPKFVGTELFPTVKVEKEGLKIPKFGKEAFRRYKTLRAVGGDTNLYSLEGMTTIDVVLQEYDFGVPIDYRTQKEALFNEQKRALHVGTKAIDNELEIQIATIAQNPSNYSASHKKALSNTTCWDQSAGHPVADIVAAMDKVSEDVGVEPNVMLVGAEAWTVLKEHSEILGKIKHTQNAVATEELVASIFGLKKVVVGKAIYEDGGTMKRIWGDNVILAYVPEDGGSYDEPAAGYTLQMQGYRFVDEYDVPGNKVHIVRTTDMFQPALVGADAMYLISNIKK